MTDRACDSERAGISQDLSVAIGRAAYTSRTEQSLCSTRLRRCFKQVQLLSLKPQRASQHCHLGRSAMRFKGDLTELDDEKRIFTPLGRTAVWEDKEPVRFAISNRSARELRLA